MPFAHGVHYLEAGEARGGAPIVLIHGAGMWRRSERGCSTPRAQAGTIAIDLPGHGRSEGGAESVAELRDAVGALAATLCLGRSILVGHSLGGLVALDAALAWPDKIAALALVMDPAPA